MLLAHRKGGDDTFQIKVVFADLDKETTELVKTKLKTDVIYKAHLEKLEDDWKLLKLRENSED